MEAKTCRTREQPSDPLMPRRRLAISCLHSEKSELAVLEIHPLLQREQVPTPVYGSASRSRIKCPGRARHDQFVSVVTARRSVAGDLRPKVALSRRRPLDKHFGKCGNPERLHR
jgi:hypothetical protein